MARLKEEFKNRIKTEIKEELGLKSIMEVPRLQKIVLNTGVGEAISNKAAMDEAIEILELISGQKAVVTKARKAVAAFKVREGMPVGATVTLRGDRMWEFLDKLINIVFPRVKDFRGVSKKSFDGSGNYSVGIEEHTVFPEIDSNKVHKIRGLQINIVTSSRNDQIAMKFLDKLGFPFVKDGK